MSEDLSLKATKKEWHGSYKAYGIGFIGSLALTLLSFFLVATRALSGPFLIYTITGLALIQGILQLFFFLHVGEEDQPRWDKVVLYFMVLVLVIIVAGTLWIMYDLNDRVMSNMT